VADAAVVGLPDEVYGQRVVAAVVARSAIEIADLDAHVKANLTSYKVPSQYVVVDHLPLNSTTGKVDKRELASTLVDSAITA
jgi:acyl-CoA synthetase (AMP-forming)/AMP-acid ligase II